MTKVVFTRRGNSIVRVRCDGHTGYGAEGEDIVCAALSSIVQTAVLGIMQLVGVNADYQVDSSEASLSLDIPKGISDSQRHDCDIILNTLLLGVNDLYQGYSDFIELEVN